MEQEDEERKRSAQKILAQVHGLLEAYHRASRRTKMTQCRTCDLTVIGTRLETTSGGAGQGTATFDKKKTKNQCNWWRAARGGQYGWRNPSRILVITG